MNDRGLVNGGPMLNAYPDSMGGTLGAAAEFLKREDVKETFSSFYILPSIFHTDLDRGFSVIDYTLNRLLAKEEDLETLQAEGISLKLDFILNHASVLSAPFQDILKKGEQSRYKDFFINWNTFWEGHGKMTKEGYIEPEPEMLKSMFFRKPGLPILMVRYPDGQKVPYWNTFYQEIKYQEPDVQEIMEAAGLQYGEADMIAGIIRRAAAEGKKLPDISFRQEGYDLTEYRESIIELLESKRRYLGQMDLNIKSPLVWEFYEDTLKRLASYGARIVRLDAFAYAPKDVGKKNFLNEPDTWELLEKVKKLADKYGLLLLPEIHAGYEEKVYEVIAQKGFMTYDFFLPGLVIDALESKNGSLLKQWAQEQQEKHIYTVNMLGCHDGIPLLDLKGLLSGERIEQIIDIVVGRGGIVKDLHGQKNVYYQVNATYYSALGEDDAKMLLARALQLFMPGKPQIWYLDLFAGRNDYEAIKRAGSGGHKEINRTNLTGEQIEEALLRPVVQKQLEMLHFRNLFPAFGPDAELEVLNQGSNMVFLWRKNNYTAELQADLDKKTYCITGKTGTKTEYTIRSV